MPDAGRILRRGVPRLHVDIWNVSYFNFYQVLISRCKENLFLVRMDEKIVFIGIAGILITDRRNSPNFIIFRI